ncbi:spermine/spermidine synthase domain-containing protein [Novosphingobium malaysiense]|uniref:Spermidine synthase n=1 Tax=Novosphingobium malaysiense TaxID=1348853 RepID=A0A0B1ZQ12_9SPHN|nr:spermidine synthase [Novosphingobium malaysiense]KHK93210.1 spermidine synthase [Novosphingobium malaysiense]
MIDEDVLVGIAHVPGGVELRLVQHGDGFTILLEDNELMSTVASASEEALATMTCERLGNRERVQMLVGGYGMGFTLRAALAALDDDANVFVAEIVPEIIEWALGPMRQLTGGCLDDPRVMLVGEDVAMLIRAARGGYDAILLDVDNGPEGLTRLENDRLYSREGLRYAMRALSPGGVLAIWSAWPDPAFTDRLEEAGFEVSSVTVRARPNNKGFRHVIWFARKP